LLQFAVLVFLLDQFTKYLVIRLLPPYTSFPAYGFFRFTHIFNTGSAFGILEGMNTPLIFVSFIGVFVLVMIYRSQDHPGILLRSSLALQLGGAFGNLVDRLRLGHVTDFIDIGPWPVFNLADASIVTGLILLGWILMRPRPATHPAARREVPTELEWCPVCDGEMVSIRGTWRCTSCGVKERRESSPVLPEVTSLPPAASNHHDAGTTAEVWTAPPLTGPVAEPEPADGVGEESPQPAPVPVAERSAEEPSLPPPAAEENVSAETDSDAGDSPPPPGTPEDLRS
jgi:signal peptidase II